MRRIVFGTLLCGVLSTWVAAVALGHGRLPAGTPYAAEIRVTLTYDGTFTKDESFQTDCSGSDGDVKQSIEERQQEHISRTILFKHITVPVVPVFELGNAAKRLALKPTVTDPGHTTREGSSYTITGTQADDSTCPQAIRPYACAGVITNVGTIVSFIVSGGEGFDPEAFDLPTFSHEVSNPAGCSEAGQTNVADQLGTTAAQADSGWQEVRLQGLLSSRFHALRSHREVSFSVPVPQAKPCFEPTALSCSQSATGSAQVKMQRLFLYRTKKSYAK